MSMGNAKLTLIARITPVNPPAALRFLIAPPMASESAPTTLLSQFFLVCLFGQTHTSSPSRPSKWHGVVDSCADELEPLHSQRANYRAYPPRRADVMASSLP